MVGIDNNNLLQFIEAEQDQRLDLLLLEDS